MGRLFGRATHGVPDLITVIAEPDKDGSLKAWYVGEGSYPAESTGYVSMDALVAAVD